MRLKSRMGGSKSEYKTLFEGAISEKESLAIYRAALETLENFRFVQDDSSVLDGTTVSVELQVGYQSSLRATFSMLETAEKASPGIARIYGIINKHLAKIK